jgi:3'-phosphoadenosine 5'-phosphosulfate sulfotransferase
MKRESHITLVSELLRIAKDLVAEGPIFTMETANDAAEKMKAALAKVVPFVNVKVSSLGGPTHVTLMLVVSLDPREQWNNNILENSRYFRMSISAEGVVEQFTKDYHIKEKFRKTRVKDVDGAIRKIEEYIKKAGE